MRNADLDIVSEIFQKAFAALWLSFCPNLTNVLNTESRILVFRHSVFRMQLASLHDGGIVDNAMRLYDIPRETAFEHASDRILLSDRVQDLRQPIAGVRFSGVNAAAYGRGIKQVWLIEVGKQIFEYPPVGTDPPPPPAGGYDESRKLFKLSQTGNYVNFNKQAQVSDDPLAVNRPGIERFYKAAGRYVGFSIINRSQIPQDLSIMFYAVLMGRRIDYRYMQEYDGDIFTEFDNCVREFGIFVGDRCIYYNQAIHFLNADGDEIANWPTGNSNRDRRWMIMNDAATNYVTFDVPRINTIFSQGIYDVIPKSVLACGITAADLRLIVFGTVDIDIVDLITNLNLTSTLGRDHEFAPNSREIEWLRRYLRSAGQRKVAKFLEFAEGVRRAPPGGFREAPIYVKKFLTTQTGGRVTAQHSPEGHTCFRRIDIPQVYPDYAHFETKMNIALGENVVLGIA